ncbi:MAG: winged helix-turn-helix domain-containing protein [Acidobacteria bacterium]|nr:winged helix-turn-helix domain-containing protein [Acidobacteriota bacterium]
MSYSSHDVSGYRFGFFQVDLGSSRLLRKGVAVKLQEQPFRLLLVLLENVGEVVTRDDLRQRLWPQNTFVEFDNSLSVAVRKLRDALGDDADNPRFVETVPRRGYRFLGPVSRVEAEPAANPAPLPEPVTPPVEAARPVIVSPAGRGASRRWWVVGAIAALVLAGITIIYGRSWGSAPLLSPTDPLVLADFENTTGDVQFDRALEQALRVKLLESPYFNIVSESRIRTALQEKGRPVDLHLSSEVIREVCPAVNARAFLAGAISASREGYELRLQARECHNGRVLATEDALAANPNEVLPVLGRVTDMLRAELGESKSSVEHFGTPMVQATTSSLAALKAFSMGEALRAQGKDFETISFYRMAADLDPRFALAYARLGTIYANAQESQLASQYFSRAFDLRDHTTEHERLVLTTDYYGSVTRELDKEVQAYEIWRQLYPNDIAAANDLADTLIALGQPEKAVEPARDALRINPANGFPYQTLAQAYQRSGRLAEAKSVYQEAVTRKLDGLLLHITRYHIAFAENDSAEMERQMAWARGNQREGEMLDTAAMSALAQGQTQQAHQLLRRARDIAQRSGLQEYAALVILDDAQFSAELGQHSKARSDVADALQLAPHSVNVQAWSAWVLARTGDLRRSEELSAPVARALPLDTITNHVLLPTIRALGRLQKKDPAGAIQELEVVRPYDLCRATELAPIYYRGLAYLELRQPKEAAEEFQRLLRHSAVRPNSPYISLSQLGLARAQHSAGNSGEARQSYQTFLTQWQGADRDLALLTEARAESARLSTRDNTVKSAAVRNPQ